MTITPYLNGATPTEIQETDKLQFAGAAFDSAIAVNAYNDSTHVESSVGANDSSGNTPRNNKFISQAGGTGGDSQVDIGAGTVDLDTIADANCAVKINVAHNSAVALSEIIAYVYDGITPATAPTELDIRLAEQGDANWTEAEGSAAALELADSGSSTSHDIYMLMSVSPTTVGAKTGTLFFGFTYQ